MITFKQFLEAFESGYYIVIIHNKPVDIVHSVEDDDEVSFDAPSKVNQTIGTQQRAGLTMSPGTRRQEEVIPCGEDLTHAKQMFQKYLNDKISDVVHVSLAYYYGSRSKRRDLAAWNDGKMWFNDKLQAGRDLQAIIRPPVNNRISAPNYISTDNSSEDTTDLS